MLNRIHYIMATGFVNYLIDFDMELHKPSTELPHKSAGCHFINLSQVFVIEGWGSIYSS